MNAPTTRFRDSSHDHVFLGTGHASNERRTWAVISLCALMMVLEVGGGTAFGSLALVADGLHMSTHVVAILIAALAYRFASRHVGDRRFTFGTGKVGDLAGFASATILVMIALLVAYQAIARLFKPVIIHFPEAVSLAILGLTVNVASAWLLSGSSTPHPPSAQDSGSHATHRDHNFRSAFVHVAADALVSVLAIVGLLAAGAYGWMWIDPIMGLVGAAVIAAWAGALVRDTTRVLIDMTPDSELEARIRHCLEVEGDSVRDLHLWRLGPGHLGLILSIATSQGRSSGYYKSCLQNFNHISHVTVEVLPRPVHDT
jgi:cation diffusion facilitator family transporter